jgi:hypothetical protein
MKRFLISLSCGAAFILAWIALVIFTSQDFVHEGPHSPYWIPLEWWARWSWVPVLDSSIWHHVGARLPNFAQIIIFLLVFFGPLVILFSAISYAILRFTLWSSGRHVA